MSPNARWQVADNEIYHIITRGNNRMKIFHGESDFGFYLELIAKYKALYPSLFFCFFLKEESCRLKKSLLEV